jgi:hypothetical protein
VLSAGIELFVNPRSDIDSFPIVAGRSEVVGVCAFAIKRKVDTPIIDDIVVNKLVNKIK